MDLECICSNFLQDKYKINLNTDDLRKIITRLRNDNPEYNDKTIISKVKDIVLNALAKKTSQIDAITDKAAFFSQLEQLEIQRNSTLPKFTEQQGSGSSSSIFMQDLTASPQQQQPSSSSVIFVPTLNTTIQKSFPIIINSINRDWEYFTSRTLIGWSGKENVNLSKYKKIHLNSFSMPKKVNTPTYIILKIISTANTIYEIICKQESTNCIWIPCSKELAILEHIPATPWTISLCDVYGNYLDIGKDGAIITEYNKLMNENYSIKITNTVNAEPGDILLIKKGKLEYKVTVLRSLNNTIEFSFIDKNISSTVSLEDMSVCNYSMQIILLFEATKNEKDL